MLIVDLTNCKQEEGESTTHWVRRVKEIIHSSDKMDVGSVVLMLEKNCRFEPLKQKLGRPKHDCNDMGQLMAALDKYADSDSTNDPASNKEKAGKGKRTAMARVTSITRRIKEVINVRLTSLWLTPVHRATTNGAREGHLLGQAGQVPPLSNY